MRIFVDIYHPAHVHQFKYVIKKLDELGHEVHVYAIQKDVTLSLLDSYHIPYNILADTSGITLFQKAIILQSIFWKMMHVSHRYHPDIYLGRPNIATSLCAFLFKKPHITYDNDDIRATKFLHNLCTRIFSTTIITPTAFSHDYGSRHIKIDSYKELFYLHPDVFTPDPKIPLKYGLIKDDYIVVRFVSWTAYHDVNQYGIKDKVGLIKKIAEKKTVIIVSEGNLDESLKQYQMKAPPSEFHDILAHALLLIADSQTVTVEAAMLGIPAIRCNSWIGDNDMGDQKELEQKYGLTYNTPNECEIIRIVDELISMPNLKKAWLEKRDKMLEGKVNMSNYFVNYVLTKCICEKK